jgi:hypothetical protein
MERSRRIVYNNNSPAPTPQPIIFIKMEGKRNEGK